MGCASAESAAAAEVRYERMMQLAHSRGYPTWERKPDPTLEEPTIVAYQAMIHTYAAAGDLRCNSDTAPSPCAACPGHDPDLSSAIRDLGWSGKSRPQCCPIMPCSTPTQLRVTSGAALLQLVAPVPACPDPHPCSPLRPCGRCCFSLEPYKGLPGHDPHLRSCG